LTIVPHALTATLGIGSGAPGVLNLSDADTAAINGDFGSIRIGTGSGVRTINIGGAPQLKSPSIIEAPAVDSNVIVRNPALLTAGAPGDHASLQLKAGT